MTARQARWLFVAVALAPVVLFVVTRIGDRMWLLGDSAAIDATARDAARGDLPLVGVYSRFGWQHPGPFLFYWLTPFVVLSGGHAWGSAVGGALLEGLAIVCVARVTGGRELRWLLAGLASILFTLVALGNEAVSIPWNPHIASAWFVVVVWFTWAIVTGRCELAGWWLVAGTIVVQTHAGYVPLVAVCAMWVAVRLVAAWRAGRRERPSWPSVAIAVLLWLPVVVDQLGGSGNLHSLVRWALRGGGGRVGLDRATGMVASAFRVPPDWLSGRLAVDPFTSDVSQSPVAWLVAALVVVGAVAWRTRDASSRALLGLGASLVVASIIAVAQVRDGAYTYVLAYVPAVAVIVTVGTVVAVAEMRRVLRPAACILLGVSVVWASATLARHVVRRDGDNDRAQRDFDAILQQLPTVEGRVLVRPTGGFAAIYFGLVDELDRAGVDVRVDGVDADKFGDGRVATDDEVDHLWYVSEATLDTELALERRGAVVIASTSPLSRARQQELTELQHRLVGQLRAAGRADLLPALKTSLVTTFVRDVPGVDQSAVEQLAGDLREVERSGRCQCAVIDVPVTP